MTVHSEEDETKSETGSEANPSSTKIASSTEASATDVISPSGTEENSPRIRRSEERDASRKISLSSSESSAELSPCKILPRDGASVSAVLETDKINEQSPVVADTNSKDTSMDSAKSALDLNEEVMTVSGATVNEPSPLSVDVSTDSPSDALRPTGVHSSGPEGGGEAISVVATGTASAPSLSVVSATTSDSPQTDTTTKQSSGDTDVNASETTGKISPPPVPSTSTIDRSPERRKGIVSRRSLSPNKERLALKLNGSIPSPEKPKRIFQRPPEGEYLTAPEDEFSDAGGYWEDEVQPLDGGWGWMVVFASFMIHVFADGFTYTLGIFYVHLLSYYDVSKAAAAWIVSILVGVTLGSGPLSGALVNKFGCRVVTILGSVLASLMLFLSIYASNIFVLYFTIGLGAGLGFGLIYLPAIVCVTGYFEKKRSFATGIAVCGSGLGTFVFSPLVEYLIELYNWKGAMIIISGLVLNCIFFGALFRPLEDNYPKRRPRRMLSTQMSTEAPSPDAAARYHVPRVEVSQTFNAVPMSSSDASLAQKLLSFKLRTKQPGRTVPSSSSDASLAQKLLSFKRRTMQRFRDSETADEQDMLRIKSHGCLNPTVQSLRQSEALRMTVSQPLFPEMSVGERSPTSPKIQGSQSHLLDRKDIFYRGSLLNIPEYRRDPQYYRESVVRHHDVERMLSQQQKKVCGCVSCPDEACSALTSLTDLGLLSDPIFLLFAASNFLTSIGFYAPYIFIVDRALDIGILAENTAMLLAVVGISNTISRVVLGYVSDLPWVNRLFVYNMALTICGLSTCFSIWMTSYGWQVFYAAMFGCTSGAYVGLTSVVLVDLLGMEKLTNAFGLVLMFQGIAAVIGPPICGSLYESSQNYDYTFLLAGAMIAASGLMLFCTPCIQRIEQRRRLAASLEQSSPHADV